MVKLSITHITPPQQSAMKINLVLFSYHQSNSSTDQKKDLIKTLWGWNGYHLPSYIKSWIYYSVALNVKWTPLFISEHLLHCLLWDQLHHKWDSCRVIKHPGETHRKKKITAAKKNSILPHAHLEEQQHNICSTLLSDTGKHH